MSKGKKVVYILVLLILFSLFIFTIVDLVFEADILKVFSVLSHGKVFP